MSGHRLSQSEIQQIPPGFTIEPTHVDESNLPDVICFTLDVKQSVRKTLANCSFEIEKRRFSWEMLLAEVHTAITSRKLDLGDVELNTEILGRCLKFFSSSRTNISGATQLTKDNIIPLFHATFRNFVSFFREGKNTKGTFKIRLLVLLMDIQSPYGQTTFPGQHRALGSSSNKSKAKAAHEGWGDRGGTIANPATTIRFNCALETHYGTKRQNCAIELNIEDIIEAYKVIEPHIGSFNLNSLSFGGDESHHLESLASPQHMMHHEG